jgi:hypothetical protein
VYDPQFDYRNFAVMRLDARRGSFRIAPEAWGAMDADNQRAGLDAAFRLVGARPGGRATDGSFLDLQVGATYHRFGSDDLSIVTTEFLFPGRLDLRRVGPSLAGSFVSFDLGWALSLGYGGAGAPT